MAEIPPGLLQFIKQAPIQLPSAPAYTPPRDEGLQQRMREAYEKKLAQEAADKIGGIMGTQAQPEQIGAFNEDIGGYDYQPQQQASGMFEGASPKQAQQLEFSQGLIESGNPMLQEQGINSLQKMQNASNQNKGAVRTFAMGAPQNIVKGVDLNAGKMIRARPANNEQGFETFGTPYDPRNQMVDVGTGFVNQYRPTQGINKNLTEAERQKQQGKSEVLDWFKENENLREAEGGRIAGMKKANKFLEAFETGEMASGGMRKIMSYIPFTFTEQGRMDEEFNSFAETAARQALKQSGEIRPTDADVTGMKRAMFGIGRDEQVNINLLQDFVDAAERGEYKQYLLNQGNSYIKNKPQSNGNRTSKSGIKFTVK